MPNLNKHPSIDSRIATAMSLIDGHRLFLEANTGEVNDNHTDHFVINDEGIIANNRHFIADTRMEAQPDGDGTTEGQTLLIIGYCYAYMATKNNKYLDKAKQYFDSYISYFYAGQQIPTSPNRWISNWIVNSKQPVLANYPIDPVYPTHSGFKNVMINFVNGAAQIPAGAPYFGEYLDIAFKAYDGNLGWDAVNATVYAANEDGSTNWNAMGVEYPVNWIIARTGQKIDYNGDVIDTGHSPSEYGKIMLQNTSVNGLHKFSFSPVIPVELGGYLIGRNQVQHNRPLHVPLLGSYQQMGNSADAELWFYEACYLLWNNTQDVKYYNAMQSTHYTSFEYSDIDAINKFFRKTIYATTPWTDGISYDYAYPSDTYRIYTRDSDGNIDISVGNGSLTIEQQSINYKVDSNSICEINTGALGQSVPVTVIATLQLALSKAEENPDIYTYGMPDFNAVATQQYLIPLNKFVLNTSLTRIADDRRFVTYGDINYAMQFYSNVIDGRDIKAVNADFGADSAGLTFGFWIDTPESSAINSVTYKSSEAFNLRITDDNLWHWYWLMPTAADWTTLALSSITLILSGYQPSHPDTDPRPTAPVYTTLTQVDFVRDDDTVGRASLQIYCINDMPARFSGSSYYTLKFSLNASCTTYFEWKVGDCQIDNYMLGSLNYTPGVIPYSNIYDEGTPIMDSYHGLPYPGYQSPLLYCVDYDETRLNNMIEFMYDAQAAYNTKFGVIGPVMSAYIWDRWDNVEYGPANTWTMYDFGDEIAWSGYQPRSYYWASRALYELVKRDITPNPHLITYVNNWTTWLISYFNTHGLTPTDFPPESLPMPIANDFTGHMTGLWLGGACLSYLSGYKPTGIEKFIEGCFDELITNYSVTTPDQIMNGGWSPDLKLGTNDGLFFGFWAGEILKGLGLYIMYKKGAHFDWF